MASPAKPATPTAQVETDVGQPVEGGGSPDGSQTVPVWIIFKTRARRSGYFHEPQIGPRAAGKATAWRSHLRSKALFEKLFCTPPATDGQAATWMKLVAWTTAEGFDLVALPKEKARAYYEELTNGRSPSHHLQVKAAASFLYKVLDKGNPFEECLAPRFRPEAVEISFLEASDLARVLLTMRELGRDYSGRLAAHLAEALFFTACRFHEWAQLTGDRLVRNGAGAVTTARYTHIDRERLRGVVADLDLPVAGGTVGVARAAAKTG